MNTRRYRSTGTDAARMADTRLPSSFQMTAKFTHASTLAGRYFLLQVIGLYAYIRLGYGLENLGRAEWAGRLAPS